MTRRWPANAGHEIVAARSRVRIGVDANCRSATADIFRPIWLDGSQSASLMTRAALVPELYVSDLATSLVFYLDVLGFQIGFDRPEDKFVCLRLGEARLMLEEARSLSKSTAAEFESGEWRLADLERPFGRGMNLEIEVEDIVATDHRLREREISMLLPLHEKTYRVGTERLLVKRFLVADPDGYLIRFSQQMKRETIDPSDLWRRALSRGGSGQGSPESASSTSTRTTWPAARSMSCSRGFRLASSLIP